MEAASAAVSKCASEGYGVTAVVVDADGVQQVVLRGDNAGIHTVEGAYDKAYVAVSIAPIAKLDSTSAMSNRLSSNPALSPLQFLPHVFMIAGGLTIKAENEVIGGIGVGGAPGGNLDEACARAGLDRIMSQLK